MTILIMTLFGTLVGLGFAFYRGNQAAKAEQAQKELKQIKVARKIENETENLTPTDVDKQLGDGGWLRK